MSNIDDSLPCFTGALSALLVAFDHFVSAAANFQTSVCKGICSDCDILAAGLLFLYSVLPVDLKKLLYQTIPLKGYRVAGVTCLSLFNVPTPD